MATHLFSRLRDRIGDKYFYEYDGIEYTVLIRWYGTSHSHVVVSFIPDPKKYFSGKKEYHFMDVDKLSKSEDYSKLLLWLFKKIGVVK